MKDPYWHIEQMLIEGMSPDQIMRLTGISDEKMERCILIYKTKTRAVRGFFDLQKRQAEESGPVITYKMTTEEIQKRYGGGE